MNNLDKQYLDVLRRVLDDGIDRPDRTGVGSRAIWGATMDIDLSEGFPIITHRKVALRIAFEEIMWMLRGDTNSKHLEEKKINIWKGNTSREFLDMRELTYLPEGHIGKSYSFQWRNFGGGYKIEKIYEYLTDVVGDDGKILVSEDAYDEFCDPFFTNARYDYTNSDGKGVDQVKVLLEGLQNDPNGRRHIITGWNPQQLNDMALPPCHLYQQYQILNGKLNSTFVMRSADWVYGQPYNVMGYAILNMIFSKYLGLKPGKLFSVNMDTHIYDNQITMAEDLINRTWFDLPTLNINKDLNSLEDILSLEFSDIELVKYQAHPDYKNKPKMAI